MTDSTVPVTPAPAVVDSHMNALMDAKADAQAAKHHAESVLADIHDFAVKELADAKTFAQKVAPYVVVSAASVAVTAVYFLL